MRQPGARAGGPRRGRGAAAALRLAALLVAGAAPGLQAQHVTFSGHGDPEVDRQIRATLSDSAFVLLARDTTIGSGDTLTGPVLAPGIRLQLNGVIRGNLVGVASDLFLHPRSVVTGDVVNGGGGVYPSASAQLGGSLDRPLADYSVTRQGDTIRIRAHTPWKMPVRLDGLKGLYIPRYDRVDGLWPEAGATLRLPRAPGLDSLGLHGVGGWRTGGPGASGTIDLQARRGRYTALAGAQRLTRTPDRWLRGDLPNSLAFLLVGTDDRDYYDARRLFAVVARDFDAGAWGGHVVLTGAREIDQALPTHDTWAIVKPDSLRPNPAMAGTITSASAQGAINWMGWTTGVTLGGMIEVAGKGLGGDYAFARYVAQGDVTLQTFRDQTLGVSWRAQGPLPGTDSLPRQRWSHVGGPATLPTFTAATFSGDRLVYVSSEYVVPLPQQLSVSFLGPPSLVLLHTIGMAWTYERSRRFEQNVGLELRLYDVAVRLITDPARAGKALRFSAGFALSLGRFTGSRPYFDSAAAER